MKNLLTCLTAFSLLASVSHLNAASSIDLSVKGKITPASCKPSLSNGGVYDLGKISARSLNLDSPTALPVQSLQLTILCEGSTLVALKPSDNRPGSHFDSESPLKFGMGLINDNEKVGSVALTLLSITADGAAMYPIGSAPTNAWAPTSILSPTFLTSFTFTRAIPELAPDPIRHLSADVQMTPTIAPANTLTLTREAPVDASVTLEIIYL